MLLSVPVLGNIIIDAVAGLGTWTLIIWVGRLLGICLVPSVLLQRSTRPMTALAWILALIFIPYIGAILWWGLGRNYVERRSRRHEQARDRLAESFAALPHSGDATTDDKYPILHDEGGLFPQTSGNDVAVFRTSETAYDGFAAAIEEATDHIHIQFYIWRRDDTGIRFRDLLAEKARQGVEVRLLYDPVGSVKLGRRFFKPIVDAGGEVAKFLPLQIWEKHLRVNFRNHRKLLVIDGRCGFTGGINISDEYLEWFDMACGYEGDAVLQMQELFAEDWHFATGENLVAPRYFPVDTGRPSYLHGADDPITDVDFRLVASGPDDRVDRIQKMFFVSITSAQNRAYVITPYLVPDGAILTALETAAMRGVDVRIVIPARSDVPLTQYAGRAFWEPLLESGVRLYEFQPRILHAKLLLVDHRTVVMGSANMDVRSFRLNFEANAIMESPTLSAHLHEIFQDALRESEEVQLEEFRNRSRRTRFAEGVARLFSPLL